jgi:type II secretory ATPase GspE/PulE/Tfp pilus assembly ATPase PilB-like protein
LEDWLGERPLAGHRSPNTATVPVGSVPGFRFPPDGTVDVPSFSGFPWIGTLLTVLLGLTAAAFAAAASWVRRTTGSLQVPRPDRWNLLFGGLCLALLAGVVLAGLPALAVAWAALLGCLIAFARQRDALVPESRRYLCRAGLRHIMADLGTSRSAGGGSSKPAARLGLREQASQLLGRLRASAVQGRKRAPRTAAADSNGHAPDGFAFLKKDGTTAIQMTAEGDCQALGSHVSENVCNARNVMLDAIGTDATDLHLEPHEQEYMVRARVDGVLRDIRKLDAETGKGVISAIKVIADMDIAERRRPQDGTFAVQHGSSKFDIRVASTPTSYGEKVVMRLLRSSGGLVSGGLDSIGLRPPVLKQLRELIHRPYGMFLVVGPTGSGKTTTVYASLSEIDAHQHNITTIEDPVEYRLDNITQIAVNTKADVSFASILRSVLRQDPDVLLVGEIRDKETAEIACQAALTGHFVFSTLHANDSVATITRLLDLGLEPTLIQTAITAVLGQRLARRLCSACKEPCEPPAGMLKKFKLQPGAVPHIYREKGCEQCGGTGYRGRLGIHELLVMNNAIRSLVTPSPSIVDLKKAAVESGTLTLQIDGLLKVIQGETSVNEVLRVTN